MSDASLKIGVDAETQPAEHALRNVRESLGKTEQSAVTMGASMAATSSLIQASMSVLSSVVKTAVDAVGGSVVGMNSKLEQAGIAFETMLGSAERAQAFLADLRDFAAKTPFEFPELVDASKKMLAFGFSAQQVRPMLTSIGDAAAGLDLGAEGIKRITTALGQMQMKGKVSAEEINQLAEAGINGWEGVAKAVGVDVPTAMKMAEQGAITAAQAIPAILANMDAKTGGMMEKMSHTFQGAMSNLKDSMGQLASGATQGFFNVLSGIADKIAQFTGTETFSVWAQDLQIKLGALNPTFEALGQWLMDRLPAAMSGVEAAVGGLVNAFQSLGPTVATMAENAGPLLAAAWNKVTTAVGAVTTVFQAVAPTLTTIYGLVSQLADAVNSRLGEALAGAGGQVEGLVRTLDAIKTGLEGAFAGAGGQGLDLFTQALTTAGDAASAFGTVVSTAFQDLQIAAVEAVNVALPVLENLKAWFDSEIVPKIEVLKESWDGFWSSAGPLVVAFWGVAKPVFEGIGTILGTVVLGQLKLFKDAWDSLMAGLGTAAAALAPILGPAFEELGKLAKGAADGVTQALIDAKPGVALAAEEVGTTVKNEIIKPLAPVGAEVEAAVTPATAALKQLTPAATGAASGLAGMGAAGTTAAAGVSAAADAAKKLADAANAPAERDLAEQLEAVKTAALGGALAIQDHTDALNREKVAALGGEVAIRDHTETLNREKIAALGGEAAIRDHEEALQREKTAALGGEVGIRAHAEALNEEKIAALGGRAAILDHQAALQKLDNEAKQSQTVFASLADQMANYAQSHNANAVQISNGYSNANRAVESVMGELGGELRAQVKAAQNAGDAYGALSLALEKAGVGYQDIAGLINGEREATERLNTSIQQNVAHRQAQAAAAHEVSTQMQAAIRATAGAEGAANRANPGRPVGGGPDIQNLGSSATGSGSANPGNPFANPAFASWYQANYAGRETFINENAANPAAMATVRPMEAVLEQFRNRFMQSFEEVTDHEKTKITEALSHAGETAAQRETRTTGVPTAQTNVDNTVQGIARQALTAIEATMTIQQSAALEYTAQLQGAAAALSTQGRSIDTTVTAEEALAQATDGLTGATRVQHTTRADIAAAENEAARQVRQMTVGTGDATRAISSMPGNIESWAMSIDDLTRAQQDYWGALKSAAQALRNNTTVVAGQTIGQGLTYGQIYGNTGPNSGGRAGGSNQGVTNIPPGNYYGIPVVSPVTGGTLHGFANGGMITRPTLLTDEASGRTFGRMAENGPESIGGGTTNLFKIDIHVNGTEAFRDSRMWETTVDQALGQVLQKRGFVRSGAA